MTSAIEALRQLRDAANEMLVNAWDREETVDEESGDEYEDWKALRVATAAAERVLEAQEGM